MKKVIAMLLAGGQGSRLHALTQNIAKPAIPYGGKYRIIDFALSNCINSGIDTVGVLTQYQPLELNAYIGDGRPWDLDRQNGGVHVLPPYQKSEGSDWYIGTANAIYQNIHYIEGYEPEYVVVLSGDHIYKMNYMKMVDEASRRRADCAISVIEVPPDEASRFGIMDTNKRGWITEFEEKPKAPKSNLASMGIYVFRWEVLRNYLERDHKKKRTSNDFGKDIIPAMLRDKKRLLAYRFEGYWKDVGTIDSLWEANMDLIDPNVPFDLWDDDWRIYCRNPGKPPQFIGKNAVIQNSIVTAGSNIEGDVDFSVIFDGVDIRRGATVRDSIVMSGAVVEPGALVQYAIVAENVTVKRGAVVGGRPEESDDLSRWGIAVIGRGLTIGENVTIEPKAMIYEDVLEAFADG